MICNNRASDIVGRSEQQRSRNNNGGVRRKGSSPSGNDDLHYRHANDPSNDGIGTRSCLVLPPYLMGNHNTKAERRRQRQRKNWASSSDNTDHSSSQQSQQVNDRASLLAPRNNKQQDPRLLWATPEGLENDEEDEESDPFHVGTPSPATPRTARITPGPSSNLSPSTIIARGPVTPTSQGGGDGSSSRDGNTSGGDSTGGTIGLLSFPKPRDRGHKQRLQYEKASRKKPIYDGELEPEGVRGEEATWTPATVMSTPASAVPLRTFGPNGSTTSAVVPITPSPARSTTPSTTAAVMRGVQPSPDRSLARNSQRSDNTATTDNTMNQRLRRKPNPDTMKWNSTDISTTSSQDIEEMMSDFCLEKETGNEQSHSLVATGVTPPSAVPVTPGTSSTISSLRTSSSFQPVQKMADTAGLSPLRTQHLFAPSSTPAVSASHKPDVRPSRHADPVTPPRSTRDQQQQEQQGHPPHSPSTPLSSRETENIYQEIDEEPTTSTKNDGSYHHQPQHQLTGHHQMDTSVSSRSSPSRPIPAVMRTPPHLPSTGPMSLASAAAASGVALSSPMASVYPPPEVDANSPARSQGSNTSTPSAGTNPSQFRKSAPVDVDDTSFIDPTGNVEGINAMAIEHVMKGEYDNALHAFGEVLQVYQTQFGNKGDEKNKIVPHPLIASTYHNLGTVHSKRAMLFLENSLAQRTCRDQALMCFQGAARAARDSLGPTHPNVAVSLVRIGFLLLQARQYHNAVVTFQESLRIRVAHYGGGANEDGQPREPHALIANVYNNLGVCHMHLEEFDIGRRYLDQAVRMQQDLMRNSDGVTGEAFRTQLLELADTLCNIGGLCLEWIRKQGPDARHAMDAESAFLEALEIRTKVLGPHDPLVLQVRSLHDMVRAMPLPKATSSRASSPTHSRRSTNGSPGRKNAVGSIGSSPSRSRLYQARGARLSPGRSAQSVSTLGSPDQRAQHSRRDTNPESPLSMSPSRRRNASSVSTGTGTSSRAAAASLELPTLQNSRSRSAAPTGEMAPPPSVIRRSLSPTNHKATGQEKTRESEQASMRSAQSRNKVDSLSSYVTATSLRERENGGLLSYTLTSPVLSPDSDVGATSRLSRQDVAAPLSPKDLTRVFLAPQFIPKTARSSSEASQLLSARSNGGPGTPPSHSGAGSPEDQTKEETTYSYDAEENLVLSNAIGVDSSPGRKSISDHVDDPVPWNQYNQLMLDQAEGTSDVSTSIMVVQPYDIRAHNARQQPKNNARPTRGKVEAPPHNRYKDMTASWGSTISEPGTASVAGGMTTASSYTSVEDRMACLMRAKEILEAHRDFMDSPTVRLEANATAYEATPPRETTRKDEEQQQPYSSSGNQASNDDFGNDDGLAPLGGAWPQSENENAHIVTSEMLEKPENHMQAIHSCAVQFLKRNRMEESLQLFEIILDCQRRRHGPLHEDVAAALHNVGIANIRMERHEKALQAFEEAVRLRKGSLGRDHPHVAVSLVKVGITLLLLQRFQDSLWIFREALSVRKHALGALHPSTARIYNNIGCVHVEFDELREARRAFEAALDVQRNALCHDPESGPIQFAAATTLCNLGYLYRNRNMHEKAALVLREALSLQENVLGQHHPTVLSTLDSLAEACAMSNHWSHALKYYTEILERFHRNASVRYGSSKRQKLAEAVLLYKMSRVHRQQKNAEAQLGKLKLALRAVRAVSVSGSESKPEREQREYLETHIHTDMRDAREAMEKLDLPWV